MGTEMTDPSTTNLALDLVTWLVWADWLEEHGDGISGTRARNIARGLEKHPKGLYLRFEEPSCYMASIGLIDHDVHESHTNAPAVGISYRWSDEGKDDPENGLFFIPVSPLSHPKALSVRPDLIPLFWDKLAELGSSSL